MIALLTLAKMTIFFNRVNTFITLDMYTKLLSKMFVLIYTTGSDVCHFILLLII